MREEAKEKTLLVLLENGAEYEEFRKAETGYGGYRLVVCALNPFAAHYCEQEGIPFIMPEECFTGDDAAYQEESEARIKNLVELLNRYCSERSVKETGFPLEMGNYFFLQLYVVEWVRPDLIVSFVADGPGGLFLGFRSNPLVNAFHGLLLNSPYKDRCIFIKYAMPSKDGVGTGLVTRVRSAARAALTKAAPLHRYYYLRRNGIDPFAGLLRLKKKRALVVGSLYNWKHVLGRAPVAGNVRVSWRGAEDIPGKGGGQDRDIFREWLGWENEFLGFDLSPLLSEQMRMIEATFEELMRSTQRELSEMKKVDIVLSSAFSYPRQNHLASVAKFLGKPVVLYQHGEMNLYRDALFTSATELLYSDYYLSFGEGVNGKYSGYEGTHRYFKKAVAVGSASLDRLKGPCGPGSYILYATGKYLLNSHPFIFTTGIDSRLYRAQKAILSYLERLLAEKGQEAVWKLNNTPVHSEVPLRAHGVRTVHFEKSFVELLRDARAVILDAPATTCLEVCVTEKPLFVLMNRSRWLPEAESLIKRRAVVAYTPEELVEKIDRYITQGAYEADLRDREFIKRYGTHLDDGGSAARSTEFIRSILEARSAVEEAGSDCLEGKLEAGAAALCAGNRRRP